MEYANKRICSPLVLVLLSAMLGASLGCSREKGPAADESGAASAAATENAAEVHLLSEQEQLAKAYAELPPEVRLGARSASPRVDERLMN